jgi:predicted nucleic acid-binding protein
MPPLVVAEVLSGDLDSFARAAFGELLQDYPLHATPLGHWIAVGELRRTLRRRGINITIPDAHVAQCALDLDAVLLSGDQIFAHVAAHTRLRLAAP